jgi:hypothetical protein
MKAKICKNVLDEFGSYLSMEKGCYTVKDKKGKIQRYPQLKTRSER